MRTSRLEAFSDGVLAIIITIMVLNLKVPEGHSLTSLQHTAGTGLVTYVLSFAYVGIYWNNHHHMFQLVKSISGGVLWANLSLLFCLSLFPFTTSWVDETSYARTPMVAYGVNLVAAGVAYFVLQSVIVRNQGSNSPLREALGRDVKGKGSIVVYLAGIACVLALGPVTRAGVWLGFALYVAVAVAWLVPDRRVEKAIRERGADY